MKKIILILAVVLLLMFARPAQAGTKDDGWWLINVATSQGYIYDAVTRANSAAQESARANISTAITNQLILQELQKQTVLLEQIANKK